MSRRLMWSVVVLVTASLAVAGCKEKRSAADWSSAVNWTPEMQMTRSLMEYSDALTPPPSVWVLMHAPGACPEADGLGPKDGADEFESRDATKKLNTALNDCIRRKQGSLGPMPKLARTIAGTLSLTSLQYDFERKGFPVRCPSEIDYEKDRVEGVFGLPATSLVKAFRADVPGKEGRSTPIVTAMEFVDSAKLCSSPLFFPMAEDAAKALKQKLGANAQAAVLAVEFAFTPEAAKSAGSYVVIPARLVAARVVTSTGQTVLPSIDL